MGLKADDPIWSYNIVIFKRLGGTPLGIVGIKLCNLLSANPSRRLNAVSVPAEPYQVLSSTWSLPMTGINHASDLLASQVSENPAHCMHRHGRQYLMKRDTKCLLLRTRLLTPKMPRRGPIWSWHTKCKMLTFSQVLTSKMISHYCLTYFLKYWTIL